MAALICILNEPWIPENRKSPRSNELKWYQEGHVAMGDTTIETMVFAVFLVVGFGLLGGAGYSGYRRYTILKTWPSVEAVVMDSDLYRHRNDFVKKSGRTTLFGYTVNGKEYKSRSSSFVVTRSYNAEQKYAEKYAPGSRHSIRYDPENPNNIRFDVGYNMRFLFVPVVLGFMGLVFSGLGLVFVLVFRTG